MYTEKRRELSERRGNASLSRRMVSYLQVVDSRFRKFTILWYSISTFLCAFAQNFEQLFVLRALHGLGFGGEWAAGAVLMGEVIRDKYRGRGVGIVQTGWAVGWGAAAIVYIALYWMLPDPSPGGCCSGSAWCPRSVCSGSGV